MPLVNLTISSLLRAKAADEVHSKSLVTTLRVFSVTSKPLFLVSATLMLNRTLVPRETITGVDDVT
jgi:hypothetical protein